MIFDSTSAKTLLWLKRGAAPTAASSLRIDDTKAAYR